MATPFKTGRQRTLSVSGTISGELWSGWPVGPSKDGDASGSCFGEASALCAWSVVATAGNVPPFTMVSLAISASSGGLDSPVTVTDGDTVITPGGESTLDVNGSWSCSVDVEEWCQVEEAAPATRTDPDAFGFPQHGGSAAQHGLPSTVVAFFEATRIGGEIVTSVTSGSTSATATKTIAAEQTISRHDVRVRAEARGWADAWGVPTPCAWSVSSPFGVAGFAFTLNESPPGGAVIGTVDGTAGAAATVTGTGLGDTAECMIAVQPPLVYGLDLRARTMESAYPSSVDWRYLAGRDVGGFDVWSTVVGTPDATHEVEQRWYTAFGAANRPGVDYAEVTWEVDELAPMIVRLPVGWLQEKGEDERDWRLQIRGMAWPALTDVLHELSVGVPIGDAGDWTAGANTTLTDPGGVIRMVVSGGEGGGTRTWDPAENLECYRYLRVRIRSTVGNDQPVRIGIGSKWWDVSTVGAGTWVNHDLDLCSPGSETADSDGQSSRYPVDGSDVPEADGPYWGVSRLTLLAVSNLADGETYELESIELRRASWSRATISHAFTWRPNGEEEVDQLVYLCCDGRLTDLPAMTHELSPESFAWRTVLDLGAHWTGFPGWSLTVADAHEDGYHDPAALPAALLFGGGAVVDQGSGSWTDGWELSCTAARDIVGQDLFDELTIYPGIGNPFDGSGYAGWDEPCPVRVNKVLRGGARGIVLKQDGSPFVGAAVTLTGPGPASAGSATSGTLGVYRTGSPWAKAPVSHDLAVGAVELTDTYENRRWIRGAFRGSEPGSGGVHVFERPAGWLYALRFDAEGLWIRRYWIDRPAVEWSLLSGEIVDAQGAWDYTAGRIRVVYSSAGTVSEIRSLGNETMWSEPAMIASGLQCAIAHNRHTGITVVAYYDAGTWKTVCQGPGASTWEAGGNIAALDQAAAGLEFEPGPVRRLRFVAVDGGDVRTWLSMDHGTTWVEA